MKIAMIGTGNVGQALARGWTSKGHQVIFGSRDPAGKKAQMAVDVTDGKASVQREQAAVQAAEVVVLAVPWSATEAVVKGLGDLRGKVLIDATNPIGPDFSLVVSNNSSGGELVQQWAVDAQVVKAFNTTGYNNMLDPVYHGESTTMFIAGNDPKAKATVTQLAEELGFDVADVGNITKARYLEPLAMVWITLAMAQGIGREIAWKLMRR